MSDCPLSCPSLFNMRSCPDVFTYRYIAMNLKHAAIGRPLSTCSFHVCPHEQATPLAVLSEVPLPLTCLGSENVEQRSYVWSVLVPKPPVPQHQDQKSRQPARTFQSLGTPTRFFNGNRGWVLGVASLLSRVNYFLSSWENKNISGFLFAEIIHRWLLGFVSQLTTIAVTVRSRVKPFSWACVSFHSITHFLPTSVSSSVLGLGFATHLACNMSCLLFLELRVSISNVIV